MSSTCWASWADAAEEIERGRRLPAGVVSALRESRIHRLAMPRELEGIEAPVSDAMAVFERLAAVDGSTAWCAVIGAGSNLFAGYLPQETARAVFADPDQGNATMFAARLAASSSTGIGTCSTAAGRSPATASTARGRVSGRSSTESDATPRVAFVPVEMLEIEDTWDSVGLRGTGSHHVSASGVPITLDRCCTFTDQPWPTGTMWRLPIYSILLPTLAAVPLGIARGALDEIGRQVREGRTARRGQLADDPIAMAEFATTDAQTASGEGRTARSRRRGSPACRGRPSCRPGPAGEDPRRLPLRV